MSNVYEPVCAIGVVTLPMPERLFLWSIRAWSAYHSDLTAVWWNLDRAFAQEGIHPALPPFHRLMSSLFDGLQRWPDIRCVVCPRLGLREAQMLAMFAHLQHGNEIAARGALQEWVLRSAARVVCECARECAEIASAAGLHFQFMQPDASSQVVQEAAKQTTPQTCAHLSRPSISANPELHMH